MPHAGIRGAPCRTFGLMSPRPVASRRCPSRTARRGAQPSTSLPLARRKPRRWFRS